ncbi:MAG TPA: hypothetical protein DFS52_14415, partial [Myxococcales bacterium]|nr:hypothetical protein [Myxococcales bacterium]
MERWRGQMPGNSGRRESRRVINREFASVEEFISEYVCNISRSGAFVRSVDPLPVGTRVALRFSVIIDEIETVEGIGEVVRVVPPRGGRRRRGGGG